MGTQFTEPTQDTETLDPKELAQTLRTAFQEYYDSKKAVIERRKKDILSLRSRANISASTLPDIVKNVIDKLYPES